MFAHEVSALPRTRNVTKIRIIAFIKDNECDNSC